MWYVKLGLYHLLATVYLRNKGTTLCYYINYQTIP